MSLRTQSEPNRIDISARSSKFDNNGRWTNSIKGWGVCQAVDSVLIAKGPFFPPLQFHGKPCAGNARKSGGIVFCAGAIAGLLLSPPLSVPALAIAFWSAALYAARCLRKS
ncbi:hypothetical protein B296_00018560 [Ensete ventricosum]|uniref:Uncharacterized protein n=1 Tax=Ensete ventricosum TaxID=4639 RepID=A0A426ZSU9_ENSVE|nr:hypothetical protein B296_00018560 [Ensete ventricosum]